MSTLNRITKVAIVGAGGRSGTAMTTSLLATGKHTITALTRSDSSTLMPAGPQVAKVNYDDHSSLVAALRGQEALIITMSTSAPPDTQSKLLRAATEAGVSWVLPNEWAPDSDDAGLCKDVGLFAKRAEAREECRKSGLSYIAVTCGFWYEWSLGIAHAYGFDIPGRKAVFFDEGETKVNTSTWAQVGRAVAALLSLPIKAEDGGNEQRCLEAFRNKHAYISSFTVSQRDMLDSLLRVTGTKEAEWTVERVPAKERFEEAVEAMKKGDRMGYVRAMYTRVFYQGGVGEYGKSKGLANVVLDLPEEDLDEFTAVAVERSQGNPFA